ncbi:DMT family transporter [Desertivibrio insolitus]|uniref:DMT family transporter n=1 Tax=Herbiconiux sp. SYSU D00978 TaxID=2812562 RepID=UPI001A973305|nr:EamA family transporter [Herbiconiux sp. SYSU D00978]
MRSSGAVALVLASVLWGTTGTAASFLPDDVSPLATGSATMAIGGALLFAVSGHRALAVLRESSARRWLLLGAVGVFVYPLAFYSGMNLAGVAVGNVVALGSGPIFAALLEWAFERHRPSALWSACTAVALVGIVLLALGGHGAGGDADAAAPVGVLLALLAGLAYAAYTYAGGRVIALGHASTPTMGAMFGLGAVPLAVVLVLTGAPLLQSNLTIGVTAYLALGPMLFAYVLFGVGLRAVRSTTVTTITLLEPVVATALAVLVVGERLDLVGWAGLALILLGVVVLATARRPVGEPARS